MDRREDERAGRPVAQQFVEEEGGDLVGMRAVREGGLGGIDMALEPLQQLPAVRGDAGDLRIMDVRVDEAGDDQAVQSLDRHAGEAPRQIGMRSHRDDQPVLDHQQPVGIVAHRLRPGVGRVLGNAQYLAAKRLHAAPRSCSNCASTEIAMTSGSLPWMSGAPIGQVRRAASTPSAASRDRKRARLVRDPIMPT